MSDLERVYKKLDSIDDKITSLCECRGRTDARLSSLTRQVYAIWGIIVGGLIWTAKQFIVGVKH